MAQADVLNLVALLSNGMADQQVCQTLYADILYDWGSEPILTNASLLTLSAKQRDFAMPPQALDVLGVIWDQVELGKLTLRQVEALNPWWRTEIGSPRAYIEEGEATKVFGLYPTPFVPSGPNTAPTGEPFGADYPLYSVVLFNTETRVNVPVYLELPLAMLILEREFVRESPHRDEDFAQMAGDFGRFLKDCVLGPVPRNV